MFYWILLLCGIMFCFYKLGDELDGGVGFLIWLSNIFGNV